MWQGHSEGGCGDWGIEERLCLSDEKKILDLTTLSVSHQKYCIVCAVGHMFRAWWVANQFSFGYTDDMYQYWDQKLVPKNLTTPMVLDHLRKKHISWNERTRKGLAAETSIVLDYFRRMEGKIPEVTVADYWERLKKLCYHFM